ncbi:MAG: alpha/beta hydrolase family protein [Planctomycetota bacterium]|jgi:dienelactone hydrolase
MQRLASVTSFTVLTAVALALTQTLVPGQIPSRVAVGYVAERFPNPTKNGNKRLTAMVFYAAKKNGQETPVLPQKDGYPVVVVLHGLGTRAWIMYAMASQMVQAGYIVVANDTGQFDPRTQANDAAALFAAMVAENKNKESEFKGQLDMSRAGICGHSMGGGNTVRVLANNPGYKAGFCFSPWSGKVLPNGKAVYVDRYAPKVTTPLGIVHGTGDRILPWRDHAHRYIEAMKETPAPKFLYLLNRDCDHINVAVAGPLSGKRSKAVFYGCAELAVAFFDCHLRDQPAALDKLLGKDAKKHNPRLEKLIVVPGKKNEKKPEKKKR